MIVVEELSIRTASGALLLAPISLRVPSGGILGLRGPSGCGKSTLMRALVGQVPVGTTATGSVRVGEHAVLALEPDVLQRFRRQRIAFVGQDPGVALNPTMRVRSLLGELADPQRALEALAAVELPRSYLRRRSAELSGGEQRRIALARALARHTPVLVLDEPLAGLHGRLRSAVVRLLRDRAERDGTTIVVSGHDDAVLRELADEQIMIGAAAPGVRYDRPSARGVPERSAEDAGVLTLSNITVTIGRQRVLDGIDLRVAAGESVAVTGPSGAGKSTLARAVVGLRTPATGSIRANGRIALVPQDGTGSLNPRRTVAEALGRPLLRQRGVRDATAIAELLRTVELNPELAHRYPHELSGGQRQRVALARSLALDPAVLVCDEVTAALDPGTAEAIMTLLDGLRRDRGLALLVITHDMNLVTRYCARMCVLESGRIVESGAVADLLAAPTHDATLALLG
ncbi:ABC transporter ATP-binding protein [Nocardia sp. NPDC051570]|uniref:ABC transporter ATP-binding protein n=1 Tax=Nocardia sp. NPDC051570 TaxID=3364324 RepID=UPI0037A10611